MNRLNPFKETDGMVEIRLFPFTIECDKKSNQINVNVEDVVVEKCSTEVLDEIVKYFDKLSDSCGKLERTMTNKTFSYVKDELTILIDLLKGKHGIYFEDLK